MNTFMTWIFNRIPTDIFSRKYPVSIKGIVLVDGKIILLKNERNEWELPGGKLEPGEAAKQCAVREILEELHIQTEIHSLIDVWVYNILGKVNVVIITYLCKPLTSDVAKIEISNEHKEAGLFTPEEIDKLNMPEGYRNSIRKALKIIA